MRYIRRPFRALRVLESLSVAARACPRSPERLEAILRRGMRIAALATLQKPTDVSDTDWLETKRAFVERRPRHGLLVKERSLRGHLGSEAGENTKISFKFPCDTYYASRMLEISLHDSSGEEMGTLVFPRRFPSHELDSDEKILKAIEEFLAEDSPERALAQAEVSRAAMKRSVEDLLSSIPSIAAIGTLSEADAKRISELFRREDILKEQGLALDQLRSGGKLSENQTILLGKDPLSTKLSSVWNKDVRAVLDTVVKNTRVQSMRSIRARGQLPCLHRQVAKQSISNVVVFCSPVTTPSPPALFRRLAARLLAWISPRLPPHALRRGRPRQ